MCVSKANMSPSTAVLKCPHDEEVYLHDHGNVRQAKQSLSMYFEFYNNERIHSSLWGLTPNEVYFKGRESLLPHDGPCKHALNIP